MDVEAVGNESPVCRRRVGRPPVHPSSPIEYREQDRYMPIANVVRLMRQSLPSHARISDEAKETIQECVTEFISFISDEANDMCKADKRKVITAGDLVSAMSRLGFRNYAHSLSVYLKRYRQLEGKYHSRSQTPLYATDAYSGGGVVSGGFSNDNKDGVQEVVSFHPFVEFK